VVVMLSQFAFLKLFVIMYLFVAPSMYISPYSRKRTNNLSAVARIRWVLIRSLIATSIVMGSFVIWVWMGWS